MKRENGHTFRLDPTDEQRLKMAQVAGCARYVYNRMLAIQIKQYEETGKMDRRSGLEKLLPGWKRAEETAWLADAPSQSLQQAAAALDVAWDRFFDPKLPEARKPTFHKKQTHCSFRYPQGFKLDQKHQRVYLPKIGWVYYRKSRHLWGEVRNITVRRKNGHWYMSVGLRQKATRETTDVTNPIGLDVGIVCHVAMSNGNQKRAPAPLRKFAKKVAQLQSRRDRKQKQGSRRFAVKSRRIARLQELIANIRKNHLHELTTRLTKNHGIVCVEDLKVKNMSKSAKGTQEDTGKNVRAKAGLNREILAQGRHELRRQLDYKLAWRDGTLVAVPPQYTSQTCHTCGAVDRDSRKTQSLFVCTACGADINAAKNILAAGLAAIARGGLASPGSKNRENSEPLRAA